MPTASSPVIPGHKEKELLWGSGQSEYFPLPGLRLRGGVVLSRWALSWKERLRALWYGDVYVMIATFDNPLQPVKVAIGPVPRKISQEVEEHPQVLLGKEMIRIQKLVESGGPEAVPFVASGLVGFDDQGQVKFHQQKMIEHMRRLQ